MTNFLQILEYNLNLDLISHIEIKEGKDPGVVRISYRDHGNTYSIDLVRKESVIADPLTVNEIRSAFEKSVKALNKGAGFVSLTNFLEEEDEEDEEN
jgi:hypothetical protein